MDMIAEAMEIARKGGVVLPRHVVARRGGSRSEGIDCGEVVDRVVREWVQELVQVDGLEVVGRRFGVCPSYLSRIVRGERRPGYRLVCAGVVRSDLAERLGCLRG